MRTNVFSCVSWSAALTLFLACADAWAQQTPQRDPQAISLAALSVSAMGGVVPNSTVATGSVEVVEGSLTETGTLRILTLGAHKTREEFHTGNRLRGGVYNDGLAAELTDAGIKTASLELAATSLTPCFPLLLLADALNNPDFAFEFVGQETLEGLAVYHIRFWNTFASKPRLQHLAEFSTKDVWIDAVSGLPRKLAYEQREAGGKAPRIAVGAVYSDYRNVGGVLYPFLIERIFNGTPWATLRIDSVVLNTGLSEIDFPTQ